MNYKFFQIVLFSIIFLVNETLQANSTSIPLNSPCDPTNDQCGSLAVCELHSNRCMCNFGNVPRSDGINCQPFHCSNEGDCVQKYGAHYICTFQNICACDFDSGWSVNLDTLNSCSPGFHILLNQTCKSRDDLCGYNAFCDLENTKTCQCRLGYSPDLKGEINCSWFNCKTDSDCTVMDPHAECSPVVGKTLCTCNYSAGYKLNDKTQKCTSRNKFLGQNCSNQSTTELTCGSFAFCDENTNTNTTTKSVCKCLFGYVPKQNQMDCTLLNCRQDFECQQLDPNSECSQGICFCKASYQLDSKHNICVRSSALAKFIISPILMLIIGIIYIFV